jgi:iron complex transport system permease protein
VAALAVLLVAIALVSLGFGPMRITVLQTVSILVERLTGIELWAYDEVQAQVLWSIRVPRVLLGGLVGAGLAVSGAALQGLFRNPLADPTLIGVSSGAALAVALALVFGGAALAALGAAAPFALPVAALLGGVTAVSIVWRLAARRGSTSVTTMLLVGIAINALCGAGIGVCIYAANDAQLRDVTFWMLGSLNGATWALIAATAPFFVLAFAVLPRLARGLNAMLLGEEEAGHLGVRVDRVKRWLVASSALAVGAAVSVSGMIGFVGLVVPHIVRLTLGPDHRVLIPASALLGAIGLIGADIIARTVLGPADLPIGIVTALLGSPIFLWLLVWPAATRGRAR